VQGLAFRAVTSQVRWSPQSIVNIVATNIPGPQFPFYTGGAKMLDVWPLVPVYHSLGLNIAIVSYNGAVSFGLLADRDLVPDLDDFARHLEQSVEDYRAAAAAPVRKRRAAGPRSRPARARKQPADKPVDLGVDHQSVVASPNGNRRNVRTKTAAKIHDVV
jgi:diacylglycerol O-acyltransferase